MRFEILAKSSAAPAGLIAIEIEIPNALEIRNLDISELPQASNDPSHPATTKDIGSNWVYEGATVVLSVPSSIIPRERNYLLKS
jgi:RES domain-containing protein